MYFLLTTQLTTWCRHLTWPKLAVGAVVLQDNKILLVKRKYPPSAGWWSVPGGHVEEGETLENAVLRELQEETGLIGCDPKLIALTEYISRRNGIVKYHYLIVDYLITSIKGKLKKSDEVLDIGFFDLTDALCMNITLTTRKLINYILRDGLPSNGRIYVVKIILDESNCEAVTGELMRESSAIIGREIMLSDR